MPVSTVLITGASGEIGQALIKSMSKDNQIKLISTDIKPLPKELEGTTQHIAGDLLDKELIRALRDQFNFDLIFHLGAILSTKAEHQPQLAHQVNTCSTIDLLEMAAEHSQDKSRSVKFLFPSSIAVYGLPDRKTKDQSPPIKENEWNDPTTMYGCSKLYCEKVGIYFSHYFHQLSEDNPVRIDFRAIRFPGIVSAFTVPSGGTSDFGPEMIHAAAQGNQYACFVEADVRIPFMIMPDAVKSLIELSEAPPESLNQRVYNVTSFSFSAGDFKDFVDKSFSNVEVTFDPDPKRQAIVDSWPADVDDSAARQDWNWKPDYDAEKACRDYLLKNISKQYKK
jgi:nucleoside-diphosphate-sugar epimerase